MAKISTYSTSTNFDGSEKLLGTDEGVTKLFPLSSLQSYFSNTVTLKSTDNADFLPATDNSYDLGSSTLEWRDLYIDRIAYIDQLGTDADPTTAYISGGELDNVVIGGETPAAATYTNLTINTALYADTSAASGSKGVGTAGQVLLSNASTSSPYWGTISSGVLSDIQTDNESVYIGTSFTAATSPTWDNAYNIAIGANALDSVTIGVGPGVLGGARNIALGRDALTALTKGYRNTAIGYQSLYSAVSAKNNIAIGWESLYSLNNTTDENSQNDNIAIGTQALRSTTNAVNNIAIGDSALYAVINARNAVALGDGAGRRWIGNASPSSGCTFIGHQAGWWGEGTWNSVTYIGAWAGKYAEGAGNTAVGQHAYAGSYSSPPTGTYNTALGYGAIGGASGTGNNNIGIGNSPLTYLTNGTANIAIGNEAADANTTGDYNIAIGHEVFRNNTVGEKNTAIGYRSLYSNVGGNRSVAVGHSSLYTQSPAADGTEMYNTAMGYAAGYSTTVGVKNVFLGYEAARQNVEGSKIVAIGYYALRAQSPSSAADTYNIGIGESAGLSVSTGIKNIIVGGVSAGTLTTGSNNIVIGHSTDVSAAGAANQVVIGYDTAGVSDNSVMLGNASTTLWHPADDNGVDLGSSAYSFKDAFIQGNLKIGDTSGSTYFQFPTTIGTSGQILKVPSSGSVLEWGSGTGISYIQADNDLLVGHSTTPSSTNGYNVGLGDTVLDSLAGGAKNTAVGYNAGTALTSGDANVLIGAQAGQAITSGGHHVAIGYQALMTEDTSTSSSVAIGAYALLSQNSGVYNIGIGAEAGRAITSGGHNVIIGGNDCADVLATGDYNIAIGSLALSAEDATDGSVAIGHKSLLVQDGGSMNVSIGYEAGDVVSTGAENVIIGSQAGGTLTTGGNNVVIGRRAEVAAAGNDDCIVIGASAAGAGSNTTVIGTTATTNARVFGLRTFVTAITGNTSITAADSGETFVFNDADGAIITLPDSGAGDLTGVYFNFYTAVTITSNSHKVVCTDTTNEKLYGQLHAVDTDGDASSNIWAAQAGDSFSAITTDGTTKAQIGSHFTVTNMAADVWHVTGNIHCAGSPATPFATS